MTYRLVNVEDRAKQHPTTFSIPSLVDRNSLREYDNAKLVFEGGERLWVVVDEVHGDKLMQDRYVGVVLSSLAFQVRQGDRVVFGPEHVADIYQGPDGANPESRKRGN